MEDTLGNIIRGLISAERGRRKTQIAQSMAEEKSKIPRGHSHLAIAMVQMAAGEYQARAAEWLTKSKTTFLDADVAWTDDRAQDIRGLLTSELSTDWEELTSLVKAVTGGGIRIDDLENEKDRTRQEIDLQLDLLVFSQTKSRVPLDEQLTAPRYQAVQAARQKAKAMVDGPSPDHENAAKEAVGAVEEMARIVTRRPSVTLGNAIKELRATGRLEAPLLRGLEEIWGWASNTSGVRHGASQPLAVDAAATTYILAQSDAAIALLLSIDAA